jgi:phosphopantothenoylcysteine decarboxylase/phosphopantothenate--cysteine ligase
MPAGTLLKDKKIVLGVCGGIAAYKAAELVRLYVKAGAGVFVVMTEAARQFVTPLTFQTLSGNPVHGELFDLIQEREIGHISLAERADLVVVAPATANLVGKVASGIADDLLTTTLMATRAPVLFAPAMNSNMWDNPIYQHNQGKLQKLGYHFLEPATGLLACGWEGKGKLPDPEVILAETRRLLSPLDLAGQTLLVTAGPTREELDPVRFLSNYSSGKMGYAIAGAAAERGARVLLVSGPTALAAPRGVEFHPVVSACQMQETVKELASSCSVVIMAAAVADYRPVVRSGRKIKKSAGDRLCLDLERNPDILAELGFAAETEDLLSNARQKLTEKNLDLIVANDITREGAGFDVDTNIVRLLYRDGRDEEFPQMSKDDVAGMLLDRIAGLLRGETADQ